jgi:cobalt/nickel transport system permease protein
MNLQIDTLAYTNRLRRLPPEHKLLFAIALLLISYSASSTIQLLIALWLGIWVVGYAKISAQIYFRLLSVPFAFWLTSVPALIVCFIPFSNVSTVTEDVWHGIEVSRYFIYLSVHGIGQASRLFSQAIASTSCLYFIILTVPFTDILQTLRRLKVPALLTELLLLMYRFIFTLLQISNDLWTAQHSRGGYRTWRTSINSLGLLVGQLLRRTLDSYRRVSQSLESRGYQGDFRVWHSRQYRPSKRYSLEGVLGCIGLIALAGWFHAIGI